MCMAYTNFWRRTPAPARPAQLATLVVLGIGLAWFLVLDWLASTSLGVSALTVIMPGPGPGKPLIVWLVSVLGAAALQALVSLALGPQHAQPRAIGTVAAFAIAVSAWSSSPRLHSAWGQLSNDRPPARPLSRPARDPLLRRAAGSCHRRPERSAVPAGITRTPAVEPSLDEPYPFCDQAGAA